MNDTRAKLEVSTHSHPKVAAILGCRVITRHIVSTHSHPKVAAKKAISAKTKIGVSTHSHPKVAAGIYPHCFTYI